jgi:uncharacterized alpha/beta hydrolase family protein
VDRGARPNKIGRWKDFLDQPACGSFGVPSWTVRGLIGSAKGTQGVVQELAFHYRMGRSALHLKVRKGKETNHRGNITRTTSPGIHQ